MARAPTVEERERIEAGPRFEPEKPKPPWPERKAPPKPEPPPKPPPPTLEPVIPQPYIEPKDAKVISTDVKGNPTILQTPDGEKHYTPFQTVMWGNYGFKTEGEYVKAQRLGQTYSQYVGITKGVDKPIRVSRAEMIKAGELKGDEQFEAYKVLGVIPRGSKFLPGPGGFQGTDWSYIHPDTLKEEKGRLIARQFASVREPGVRLQEQYIKDWEARHIRLPDDQWVNRTLWNKLPERYQTIGMQQGFSALQKAYEADRAWVLSIRETYKTIIRPAPGEPTPKQKRMGFDLVAAIKAEKDPERLSFFFGTAVVQANRQLVDYTTAEGTDIARYIRDNPKKISVVATAGYSKDAINEALAFNRQYLGIGAPDYIDTKTFIRDYFKSKGWKYGLHRGIATQAQLAEYDQRLQVAIAEHSKAFDAPMTFHDFKYRYFDGKGWDINPPEVAKVHPITGRSLVKLKQYNAKMQEANNAYIRKYGMKAVGESVGGATLGFVFAPARAIYPNVKLKDIKGWEWALGAAQVALVAAPFVAMPFGAAARGATLAIQAGAIGVAGAHTVTHWGTMGPVHKGLALGIDILITAAILRGAGIRLPRGITPKALISNLRSHFNAAGMDALAVRRVEVALSDLARGIELNKPRLIRQAVSILQKEAARSPKMSPSIVKSIKDGGSYIKQNATNYGKLIQTTREMSIADDIRLLSVGTKVPAGQVPRNALARMYNLWQGESRAVLRARIDAAIKAADRHLLTLESRARGALAKKLYQEKLATEQARIARMTEREKDALIARETGKPEGYYSLQRLMDQFKREWAKRAALKRELYKRIDKEKLATEKAKVARMTEAEKDTLIEKMTGKEAGYFNRQKLMAQFKREWAKRAAEKQKLYDRIGKEKLKAEQAKIAKMTEAEKDIYLARRLGKPADYFKRQSLMDQFKREWAKREALYRKMLDRIAQDKLKLEQAKIARMTEREKDALLEKMTGKEAGYFNRQRLMGEFKREWAKREAGKQELYNRISQEKLAAEKKKWARMTQEEIDDFLEKFSKVKGKLSRKIIDKETEATLRDIESFLEKHKAMTPEQRATLKEVDDAIREAREATEARRVTPRAPEVKVEAKPEVKPEIRVKVAVKERITTKPKVKVKEQPDVKVTTKPRVKPLAGIPATRIAEAVGVEARAIQGLPQIVPIPVTMPMPTPNTWVMPLIWADKLPKPVPVPVPKPIPTPAPREAPKPEARRRPEPEPEPKPESKPRPKPVPKPVPTPVPTPVPEPEPKPKPEPEPEKPPPPPPPPTKPKPVPIIPSKKTDKEKRKIIRRSKGAIVWRQGELKGKDIWRVVVSPYTKKENWFYVVGRKPTGAQMVSGPKSAYESIRLLRGKPPAKKVTADMGIMDVSLEPVGKRQIGIGFESDPLQKTRSDIRLGHNGLPPITERPVGLGRRKSPRITPRTPALRR